MPAGRPAIAALKRRDIENTFATGGMKRPAESIGRLAGHHKVVGAAILAKLSRRLAQDSDLLHSCL
eukprot:1550793-Amphidinium_carterae.1